MNSDNLAATSNKDIFLKSLMTILDAQDAVVYVADMQTYEVLFVNRKVRQLFGDVTGKICWQTLQKDQEGPCPFCTNQYLTDEHGAPAGVYVWEFQNTITGQWFELRDCAIEWVDGRIVRFEIGTDISKRKEMEKEVREIQGDLEALLNSITETALLCRPEGDVIVANETAARRFNMSKEKLIGTNIFSLMSENALKTRQAAKEEVVSTKRPIRFTDERGGRRFDTTIYPVLNEEGLVDRVAVFAMDITERTQAELAAREEEQKFRNLFSSIRDVIVVADKDRSITDANQPALREQFGYEIEDIAGQKTKMLYASEEGFKQTGKEVFDVHKRSVGKILEVDFRKKNGEIFPAELFAMKLLDDNGAVIGNLGIVRDITDRKQAEEALRESRERLNLIIERMPTGCIMWDTEFHVEIWNAAAEAIFGYTRSEAAGKHAYDLIVDKAVVPHVDDIWRRLIAGDTTAHSINDNITKDGRVITCEWHNTPLKMADGTVIGVISMVQDVTDRIEKEAKIKRSLEEKEVLLKEIHHRVKNNMAVISSMLALQARYAEDAKVTELLEESQSRIKSMALVHEQLYKSEDFAHVDVKEYVEALARHISHMYHAQTKNVALVSNIGQISLQLDVLIPCGLIINELLSNCYKHAFEVQGKGEIQIAMNLYDPDSIKLEISDNGSGLSGENDIHHPTTFGFSIVNALVSQLHGSIETDGGAGGTRHTVIFPSKLKFAGRAM